MSGRLLRGWIDEREYLQEAIRSIETGDGDDCQRFRGTGAVAENGAAERAARYRRILAGLDLLIVHHR